MLILDNIKKQDREKFINDFDELLINHNNINVGFNFNEINFNVELFKYKSILFKLDDYDNVEKKIIRNIICYYLMKDCWQYVDVEKYKTKDKNYYTIIHYDTIINYKKIGNLKCKYSAYNSSCNNSIGYGIEYDKINNLVNYYSAHPQYCIYHCSQQPRSFNEMEKIYNLNSLFNSKYKEFKILLIKNNINVINTSDNINDAKNNTTNNNDLKNNKNDNNNIIINNTNNDTKITIEIITNTTNFTIEFINMDLEQVFNKLITSFHKGKIICDNGTYKFIKS